MFDTKQHALNQQLDALTEGVFDQMADVLPEGQQGVAKIDHFTMDPFDILTSLSEHQEDYVPEGRYARLRVNGQLMMSDSPMEKRTNLEVVEKAHGRVLIAGLGLGMIVRAIMKKPTVALVTVLEKHQDVVDLVLPSLAGDHLISGYRAVDGTYVRVPALKLEVIVTDVFDWKWTPHLAKYHTIYFDIWPDSSVRYLPEMEALYKRYRPLLTTKGWMNSWTYRQLKQKKADDGKFLRKLPGILEGHMKDHTPEEFAVKLRALLASEVAQVQLSEAERDTIRQFAAQKGITLSP